MIAEEEKRKRAGKTVLRMIDPAGRARLSRPLSGGNPYPKGRGILRSPPTELARKRDPCSGARTARCDFAAVIQV